MVTSPFVCYLTDDSLFFFLSAARAYYLSSSCDPENLTRAEAAVQELTATTENQVPYVLESPNLNCLTRGSQEGAEYQHLRWMRLALLKRRDGGDSALLEG